MNIPYERCMLPGCCVGLAAGKYVADAVVVAIAVAAVVSGMGVVAAAAAAAAAASSVCFRWPIAAASVPAAGPADAGWGAAEDVSPCLAAAGLPLTAAAAAVPAPPLQAWEAPAETRLPVDEGEAASLGCLPVNAPAVAVNPQPPLPARAKRRIVRLVETLALEMGVTPLA